MEKEGVCALLLEVNYWGEPFLSTLDFARQKEVVIWNQKATSQVGHKLSSELLQWILQQVDEGKFYKAELASALLLKKNKKGEPFLNSLDLARQKEVVLWKQRATGQVAHKISSELLQWILQQVDKGNFDKEEFASGVCDKSTDQRPPLSSLEEEAQKKLALLNKDKTILILPWLSSNLQKWIYQEAQEGRFDQDEVGKVLKKEEKEGEEVLSLKIHPGWLKSKDLHFR